MINLLIVYYFFNIKGAYYFLVINLLIALFIMYKQNKYYSNKVNHEEYYAFKRTENPTSFFRIYFGLISFVYIKSILMFLVILSCYIGIELIKIFSKKEEDYLSSNAYFNSLKYCNFINYLLVKIAGVISPKNITNTLTNEIEAVYSKYLGKNYDKSENISYPIIICNHIGWLDIFFLASLNTSTFVAKKSITKYPVVGSICTAMGAVWVDREANSVGKNVDAFSAINERQDRIMNKGEKVKITIFPEGTGSNNLGINRFKKGSFFKLNPIKPFVILTFGINSTTTDEFSISAGAMNMILHMTLTYCYLYIDDWRYIDLPVIVPNEYMFETYKHLGKDKPEIYTEVCRHIMSEISGLKLNDDMDFAKKMNYLSVLKGKTIKNT